MSQERDTRGTGSLSPFELPAMADAYPLDDAERRSVDEVLSELRRERAEVARGAEAHVGGLLALGVDGPIRGK